MVGPGLPPGLRFPTGAILGNHLIIAGTYLAQSYQSYSLWALDLTSMTWSRIDPGTSLNTGSWSRGVLWPDTNRYAIFGNRHGNLVEDYNRRLLNWDHVAYVELEAFGIYKLPPLRMPLAGQHLGLDALESEAFADFEILCEDGRKIRCSRKLLEERWPWFKRQRVKYIEAANRITSAQTQSEYELPLPPPSSSHLFQSEEDRPDPRLTPRLLRLSEPYPITKALLQYFYAWALITPLQHAPLVLSALLLLSAIYELPHLEALVKHAMHRTLSPATSVGVYEVATLCDCQNLQIRYGTFFCA
jgi:leucine-zipper-like transcriptional regulator 1